MTHPALAIKIATLMFCLFAAAQPAASQTAPKDGTIVAAWTQIVPHNNPGTGIRQAKVEARFVIQGRKADYCKSFGLSAKIPNGGAATYTKSWDAQVGPGKSGGLIDLPVTLCSHGMDENWISAELQFKDASGNLAGPVNFPGAPVGTTQNVSFVGPHATGRNHTASGDIKMITLGDTGCKVQEGQDCDSTSSWPFPSIMKTIADSKDVLDLVLHVGDYRYYKEQQVPDQWHYWMRDFFQPAQQLLWKTPWAFSRGNHEQCITRRGQGFNIWYGAGWRFLFGVDGKNCPDASNARSSENLPTWHFDVAPGGIVSGQPAPTAHRFVMIDTSNAGGGHHHNLAELKSSFSQAIDASTVPSTWWVSHIPGINLMKGKWSGSKGDENVFYARAKAQENKGFAFCDPSRKPSCLPSTILLGHQHLFQQIEFFADVSNPGSYTYPQRYIVGHGGVKLRRAHLGFELCKYTMMHRQHGSPDWTPKRKALATTLSKFGYVVWTRNGALAKSENAGWKADPRNQWGDQMKMPKANSNPPICK